MRHVANIRNKQRVPVHLVALQANRVSTRSRGAQGRGEVGAKDESIRGGVSQIETRGLSLRDIAVCMAEKKR